MHYPICFLYLIILIIWQRYGFFRNFIGTLSSYHIQGTLFFIYFVNELKKKLLPLWQKRIEKKELVNE